VQTPVKYDIGAYHANPARYQELVDEMYSTNPSVTLSPEYGQFFKSDLLRLMIRLARYKFVARLLKKTDRVLEIGSGTGLGSIFMGQHSAYVMGMDVKAIEIEEARRINRRDNVEFQQADLFEITPTPTFDVAVALDVIEHLPIEGGHKLVSAMTRFLKPGGMIVIGSPSIYSYPYQSPISQASHVKCYDQQELMNLIDTYTTRTLAFSMNDEVVHTGHPKMAWYYFVLGIAPKAVGYTSKAAG
jgi:2-polyprenyl-3-methyl-5-hydroxy-6-metoxy-1,4-benzoquinol methylase